LVIWFHFLGGSGSDWEMSLRSKLADQLPWVEWYFPDAPRRPITNYDGQVARGWFDMLEGQVYEGMETPGLDESVAATHGLLRQAEALGFPASRILLGGMSQGGVLALKAGLSYERPLAGIAAFSAWVPPGLTAGIRHPNTPLLIGSGDRDEVVPLEVFRNGVGLLKRAGCTQISKKQYPGLDHTWAAYEREDVKTFLASVLPNTHGGDGKPAAGIRAQTNLTWATVATPSRVRCHY
jgi:phospholipase/carboxylesterase